MKVRDVLNEVERLAPPHYAFGFDKVGLQVGDPTADVEKIVVSLDSGIGAIEFATSVGANLMVTHHPVIWDELTAVRSDNWAQRRVIELVRRGISLIAAHTNWDCAPGGINDALADRLGLEHVVSFGWGEKSERWKLVVFVPIANRDFLADQLSAAGAGVIGNYDRCAFFTEGVGTFRGGAESNPVIGERGRVEEVAEARIEMVVSGERRGVVEATLRAAHPYEEPAFDWVQLADGVAHPCGRIGDLQGVENFQGFVDDRLGSRSEMWVGHDHPVRRVAVVGGAASGEWQAALALGADAYITGEVPQHVALEASESGLTILACGHYSTEQPGMVRMGSLLAEVCSIPVVVFEPGMGLSGRPR
ncbi:Nif3-like dinuclear metal center hexameric protein [Armatimonadetes bacterium Uphvl-Ar1]|nr:Nif3-like dinuclear metal center hexameric protein [Armatimonadetes bacterium Uphvl-Ar1]